MIMIPACAVHYDAKFYPEPHEFKPERFSEKNSKTFLEMPFLAVGQGPRACIGVRLGHLQAKIGLLSMLRKYKYELSDELSKTGMKLSAKGFITTPENGIPLRLKNRF